MNSKRGVKLHFILSILVVVSILLTLMVCAFSALQVNKQSLTNSYLENNHQYAEKLSFTTKNLLELMQKTLQATSTQLKLHSAGEVQARMNEQWESNKTYFNSMIVVDKNLVIRAMTPQVAGITVGDVLSSAEAREAVTQKRPFISAPYHAISGKLIILVSVPIFESSGAYQGFVGGTIYLEEDNALRRILSSHFYGNGSYVYVVDPSGHIIFHPQINRIGDAVNQNPVVHKALLGQSSAEPVINTQGHSFFAGYAYERLSGWGIISQTPTSIIETPSRQLVMNMIKIASPFFLLILILSSLVAVYIAKPLSILAKLSEDIGVHKRILNSTIPDVKSGVYEVRQLYQSIKLALLQIGNRMDELNVEVQTDALTGLANRRTFDLLINEHIIKGSPFSLILLDVDHFKKVNDVYGHLVGDETLKFLANTMQPLLREGDLCFRYGGEEFAMIIPSSDPFVVRNVTERLRAKIEQNVSPTGQPITISLGIAMFPEHARESIDIISKADEALYTSKAEGRNRTTFYSR